MKEEESIFGTEPERLMRLMKSGLQADESEEKDNEGQTSTAGNLTQQPGTRIGRYKILRILGEGGMGIVYLSEQQGSIQRRVALKVIKPGMDSKRVLARFEAERQALALLDHINVANVFDSGTTESGLPYFVMEYVKGLPITDYCDHHKLTIEQRLRLFQQVCHAIHHAHQKGIIHRDIKPSNILVSTQDDKAVPKIIDFGVAKAISRPLTERTLLTEDTQLLGTPEYMSPEQADMASDDIDTRSDIYSLGVLLYELLTGVLPYDSDTLRTGGIEHIRKIIRETDPKTPSTRLTKLGDEAKKVAESRRTEVYTLARCLHKELEWIPLKAMRKERSERYRSASELADDIENYLKGDPLIAGPPSTVYHFKKFIRRHKAMVIGIAAVLVVSIIGTLISIYFALGKARALEQQIEALAQNEAMAGFFIGDILTPLAAEREDPANIREVFDDAAEKLATQFGDYPLLEAEMYFRFGRIYMDQFSDYDKASLFLNRALERPTIYSYLSMNWLGLAYTQMGKYHEAEKTFRDLLKGRKFGGSLYYAAMSHLGVVCQIRGRYDEAESYILEAPLHPWWDKGHWREAMYVGRVADLYMAQGRYNKASQIYQDLLQTREDLQQSDWDLMKKLGMAYTLEGNLEDAKPLLDKALEGAQNEFDEENIAEFKIALAVWYTKNKKEYNNAENLFDEALKTLQSSLDNDNPTLLNLKRDLGILRREQGQSEKAQEIFLEVHQRQSETLGLNHPETLETMHELAVLYIRQSLYPEALKCLETVVPGMIERLKHHPKTQDSIRNLIKVYEELEMKDEAEKWSSKLTQIKASE